MHHSSSSSSSSSSNSSSSSSSSQVQRLVVKLPALLCSSPATLRRNLTELSLLLGLQPSEPALRSAVLLQPGLLTQSPGTLASKLALLSSLTGRDEQEVRRMAVAVPALLTLSADSLVRKWDMLCATCGSCAAWRKQLAATAATTLGVTLCYSSRRLLRLQHVAALCRSGGDSSSSESGTTTTTTTTTTTSSSSSSSSGSSSSSPPPSSRKHRTVAVRPLPPWRSLVQASDAAFAAAYPAFPAWLAAQEVAAADVPTAGNQV